MGYRWKPSASQRRAFAERMKDPDEQADYSDRKQAKRDKFIQSIDTPGIRSYVPTREQNDYAVFDRSMNTSPEHDDACNMVASAFSCNEKCDHVYIHIVNELRRSKVYRSINEDSDQIIYKPSQQNMDVRDQDQYLLDNPDIRVGQKVSHLRFGNGGIEKIEISNLKSVAHVNFEEFGMKLLILKYAKLKIING